MMVKHLEIGTEDTGIKLQMELCTIGVQVEADRVKQEDLRKG